MPNSRFQITFSDESAGTIARGLDAFRHSLVNLAYRSDVVPYCANPVHLMGTTDHAAVMVNEVEPRPDDLHKHTIPFESITGIEIL